MALAATDEDAPPQPAKAYFCWIYGAAEAAPLHDKVQKHDYSAACWVAGAFGSRLL